VPELPDIVAYVEALERHAVGHAPTALRVTSPFLVRSVTPPIGALVGRRIERVSRLGKRIVLGFAGDHHLVIHLMIAGRLRWRPPGGKAPGRGALATFEFPHGRLLFTEAGTKRRASFTVVLGSGALQAIDRGGLEPLDADLASFTARLRVENHTLKRTLTDPRLFSGIGNAYSDEILHHAGLSPLALTARITDDECARLHASTREILTRFTARIRAEVGSGFPETVSAFRDDFAAHGRFGRPCPACASPIQRIRYADNETNYCARCQTGGRRLADRALSRLLKGDWPRSMDEVE
jgi:formamidopyrimidine-DNA glycosylase